MSVDPLAWVAIGFLVSILAITFGLLFWVMKKSGKKHGEA